MKTWKDLAKKFGYDVDKTNKEKYPGAPKQSSYPKELQQTEMWGEGKTQPLQKATPITKKQDPDYMGQDRQVDFSISTPIQAQPVTPIPSLSGFSTKQDPNYLGQDTRVDFNKPRVPEYPPSKIERTPFENAIDNMSGLDYVKYGLNEISRSNEDILQHGVSGIPGLTPQERQEYDQYVAATKNNPNALIDPPKAYDKYKYLSDLYQDQSPENIEYTRRMIESGTPYSIAQIGNSIGRASASVDAGMREWGVGAANIIRTTDKWLTNLVAPEYQKENGGFLTGNTLDSFVNTLEQQTIESTRHAEEGASDLEKFVGQGIRATAALVPDAALAYATGGASLVTKGSKIAQLANELKNMWAFGLRAAGGYAREAEARNADINQQMAYGAIGGLIEMGTELISFKSIGKALGIIGNEAIDKGLANTIKPIAENGLQNFIKMYNNSVGGKWINSAFANMGEEVAAGIGTNLADKLILDPNKPLVGKDGVLSLQGVMDDSKGGLAMSLVMTALGLPVSYISNRLATKIVDTGEMPTDQQIDELINALKSELKINATTVPGARVKIDRGVNTPLPQAAPPVQPTATTQPIIPAQTTEVATPSSPYTSAKTIPGARVRIGEKAPVINEPTQSQPSPTAMPVAPSIQPVDQSEIKLNESTPTGLEPVKNENGAKPDLSPQELFNQRKKAFLDSVKIPEWIPDTTLAIPRTEYQHGTYGDEKVETSESISAKDYYRKLVEGNWQLLDNPNTKENTLKDIENLTKSHIEKYGQKVTPTTLSGTEKGKEAEPSTALETNKYGRSGNAVLKKWAANESFMVDLDKKDDSNTKAFISAFEKYYNAGRSGLNSKDLLDIQRNLSMDELSSTQPWLLDVFFKAGQEDAKRDAEKTQKKEESPAPQENDYPVGSIVINRDGKKFKIEKWEGSRATLKSISQGKSSVIYMDKGALDNRFTKEQVQENTVETKPEETPKKAEQNQPEYGRFGKKAYNNELKASSIDPDTTDGEVFKEFFEKYYFAGLNGKPMPVMTIHSNKALEFYNAGKRDAEKTIPKTEPKPLETKEEVKAEPEQEPKEEKPKENIEQQETKEENGDKIKAKEGEPDGEVSANKDRTDIPKAPSNVPSENVSGVKNSGDVGGTRLSETAGSEGTGGEDLGGKSRNELRSDMGDNAKRDTSSTGEGTGEQSSENRPHDVRVKNQTSNPKGHDYVINSQEDSIIDGGKKTRARYNIEAIKLSKQILKENRPATSEEQKILSRYVGWGGIPEIFDRDPRPIYNSATRKYEYNARAGWEAEHKELKDILDPKEYELARESILNAHYTSIDVIKGIYEAFDHFGVDARTLLEPSMGIGNFIGAMPLSIRNKLRVVTGVELDTATGNIAKLLYPNCDMRVQGFEESKLANNFYDIAISNIPFGKIAINDKRYPNGITSSIHNYFIARALDVVRPGGLVMFITSSKTLDSGDTSGIRKYIQQKADFLGAVRLPNTAFKENAMTEVTTDILFLRVKEPNYPLSSEAFSNMVEIEVPTDDGDTAYIDVNEYYKNHPENVLGELRVGKKLYPRDSLYAKGDGRDIRQGIAECIKNMPSNVFVKSQRVLQEESPKAEKPRASIKTKNGSYEVSGGKLHVNRDGELIPVETNLKDKEIKAIEKLLKIRDIARESLELQRNDKPESQIRAKRDLLNNLYDAFVKEHGYIYKNVKLIADDLDIDFIKSLEVITRGKMQRVLSVAKNDIFTKNTVTPRQSVKSVSTAKEALIVSLNEFGTVNLPRMAELLKKSEQDITNELAGYIYENPVTGLYETADAYLSGNVKAKLKEAEAIAITNPKYQANVEALKAVQPKPKESWEISLRLGSGIIPAEVYKEFGYALFYRPIEVTYYERTGEWTVERGKRLKIRDVRNITTWGIDRTGFRGVELLQKVMNNKTITVVDTYEDSTGAKTRVYNAEQTAICLEKAEKMKAAFTDWLTRVNAGETLQAVTQLYNDKFNTDILRKFDGSHLPDTLEGMNPNIKLAPHQKEAIWRIISSGGNTLLAHEVGAGKTFEMIAAIMEMRRLGLINKAMVVVPNSIYEQWGIEFKRLYPGARVLFPESTDFSAKNRRVLMNRIATGQYDAVIVPESQFTMLPMSAEKVEEFYQAQVDELETALQIERDEQRASGSRGRSITEKKIIQSIKNLKTKMAKKLAEIARDSGNIDFEELGVDALFVDEAHRFKNLMYTTHLQVSGLGNPDGSDKAFDLLMKTRYLQDLNGGRGIVFATATPLLNSLSEVYNWQQYLCPEQLHQRGIFSFDSWVSVFGKVENVVEVKPEGSGYRVKNGISKITNVGMLAKMFREFTDFKTQEMLKLKRPDVKDGKYQVISVPATRWLKSYMTELAERAERLRKGGVDPKTDNMLKVTTDGRKAALDPRLVDPRAEIGEDETTKITVAANHIFEQWDKTKEERLTHLVFAEFSTPRARDNTREETDEEEDETDEPVDIELDSFYQDLKRKLVAKGIPENEIAFIHDAKNAKQKVALKEKFNNREIRILIGNNEKMGVGLDLQKWTKTITHIDSPWRPKDLQQEDGRGLRQGNNNKEIELYVMVTEGSFDSRLWDNLQRKSKLVDDILTSDLDAVEIEDMGVQTLSAQEVMGIASGNPLLQEQIVVSQRLQRLRALEKGERQQKEETRREIAQQRSQIKYSQIAKEFWEEVGKRRTDVSEDKFTVTIAGQNFTKREEAQNYLKELIENNRKEIKQNGHFDFDVDFGGLFDKGQFVFLKSSNEINTKFFIGDQSYFFKDFSELERMLSYETTWGIQKKENQIKAAEQRIADLQAELDKPFEHAEELQKLALREEELMRILNPEQVIHAVNSTPTNVSEEEEEDDDGEPLDEEMDAYTSNAIEDEEDEFDSLINAVSPPLPQGNNEGEYAKSMDDIIKIIEKHTGVPIRTGKYRARNALAIYKRNIEVIRSKVKNDLTPICHELGHHYDDKFKLSITTVHTNELTRLGRPVSRKSYSSTQVNREGMAEFMRLYLTDVNRARAQAPYFFTFFEKKVSAKELEFLSLLRTDITDITNLKPERRVFNSISSYEPHTTISDETPLWEKALNAWIDKDNVVGIVQKEAEKKGWKGKNVQTAFEVLRGLEAKVENEFFDAQRDIDGNVIGKSMYDILQPINKKACKSMGRDPVKVHQDFISYMVARRSVDYKARNLVMPDTWSTYDDTINRLNTEYGQLFRNVFKGIRQWEDNSLNLLVDAGIKNPAELLLIKLMNANHVPLQRIQDAIDVHRAGGGSSVGQSKQVIKKAKGSGATIIDPLESILSNAFIIRRAAESNNALRLLKDMSDYSSRTHVEGMGKWVEHVPHKSSKSIFEVEDIRKQLIAIAAANNNKQFVDAIRNLSQTELESSISVFRSILREGDREVIIYEKGEGKVYQVDTQLYKSIKGLDNAQSGFITRVLTVPKKVLQFGVVTTVDFVMRNIMRDFASGYIQSEVGISPKQIISGYISAMKKDDSYKELIAHGGGSELFSVKSRAEAQYLEDKVMGFTLSEKYKRLALAIQEMRHENNKRTRAKTISALHSIVRIPFNVIRGWAEFSELGVRIAEYKKAVSKGYSPDEAAALARKVTQDFLRSGYLGKEYNKVTAFFNANIQGTARLVETFKKHPVKTLIRGFTVLTLPTLLLYFFNHDDDDYKALPTWRKAMFWNIPIGNGYFLSIPRPYGYSFIFAALPEIVLDNIFENDKKTFSRIKDAFFQNFDVPLLPSAMKPSLEVATNRQWNNAPVEGAYDRENLPAYLIRGEKTSLFSSAIGDILQNESGLSPKQIDYLIKGYFGKVGEFVWHLPDTVKKGIEIPENIKEYPIIKSFVVDSVFSSDSLSDLYTYNSELTKGIKAFKQTGNYPGADSKNLPLIKTLNDIRLDTERLITEIQDAKKVMRQIENDPQLDPRIKKVKTREIQYWINKKSEKFNLAYENFKKQHHVK